MFFNIKVISPAPVTFNQGFFAYLQSLAALFNFIVASELKPPAGDRYYGWLQSYISIAEQQLFYLYIYATDDTGKFTNLYNLLKLDGVKPLFEEDHHVILTK